LGNLTSVITDVPETSNTKTGEMKMFCKPKTGEIKMFCKPKTG
jgi:hypothetical protein